MITFEFEKPKVVGNAREGVEPLLKEYAEHLHRGRAAQGTDTEAPIARAEALERLKAAVKSQVQIDEERGIVGKPVISCAPRIGQTFNEAFFWHVDSCPVLYKNVRMMASSTPPYIASGAVSFDESLLQEAKHRSDPLLVGGDSVITSLFRIVSERIQTRGLSPRHLDWIDIANRGELAESRYRMLNGLVVVEDLEHFKPDDYDVVEGEVDKFLHATAPRDAHEPTLRAFGRAYY